MRILRASMIGLFLSWTALAGTAMASDPNAVLPAAAPAADEVWLVSTRNCRCYGCMVPDAAAFDVRRRDEACQWQDASLDELIAASPMPTIVYVHGNRVDWYDAHQLGCRAYASLRSGCPSTPVRFIIWSWPSDAIRGPMRDVREKGDRADLEATCFGWFFAQLPSAARTTFIGYSYGARIVSGGLHLLGGGRWNGVSIGQAPGAEFRRAVYLAPAMDHCWLCQGGCHGLSLSAVEHLLVFYNPCDPALTRFRFSEREGRPTALGYAGISNSCLGSGAGNLEQINIASAIGKTHEEDAYWGSTYVLQQICRIAFEPPTATVVTAE
ncbi:MAG: hypothetical protein AB7F89_06590 [Pirellulaceae bacterium]